MKVSVIIPCLNEAANINDCLKTLLNQSYTMDKYEIIVVDGGSTDNTQQFVKEIEKEYENVRLIVELKKGTAAGRNAGIKASQYDYVAFIDADCEAPSDWLFTLVKHYKEVKQHDSMIVAVGGSNKPPEKINNFVHAIGITLDSFLGSFNSVQGRQFKEPVYVSSLATLNILYEKQKILKIGYFDESLGSEAEDADINFRLSTSGYRMYFIPDSFVWHKMRPTPISWMKNMFRYGKGRARLLKRYPHMWTIYYILPILFILTMFSMSFIPFSNIFILSLVYFPILLFYSIYQCTKKKSLVLVMHVMLVYLIQHVGYAVGEIYGLLNPKVH